MPRPIEMVWLCNYSSKTFTIDGVQLLPYCCHGFNHDVTEDQTIAKALATSELCVHSSYFEGQQVADACPEFGQLDQAMIHAVAAELGTTAKNLHPDAVFIVRDHVTAGLLKGHDGVKNVAAKAKVAIHAAAVAAVAADAESDPKPRTKKGKTE